jgi:hypothetical protein
MGARYGDVCNVPRLGAGESPDADWLVGSELGEAADFTTFTTTISSNWEGFESI